MSTMYTYVICWIGTANNNYTSVKLLLVLIAVVCLPQFY